MRLLVSSDSDTLVRQIWMYCTGIIGPSVIYCCAVASFLFQFPFYLSRNMIIVLC